LYQGKKAKACNNAIYDELYLLINKFEEANQTLENKQCQNLSSDIASVFKTIFTTADDENSIFQLGALLFNTSLTVARKTLEESVDTIIEQGARYPQKDKKCLVPKN
jgi:chaperonin cofactor prefoldin